MIGGNGKQLILNDGSDGSDGELEVIEEEEPFDTSTPNSLEAEDGDSHDEDDETLSLAEEDATTLKSELGSISLEIEEPKSEPETDALTGPQAEKEIGVNNATVAVGDGISEAENVAGNGDNGSEENDIGNEEEKKEEEENEDIDVEIEEQKEDIDVDTDKENEKENTDMEMKDDKKEYSDMDNDKENEGEKIGDENRGKRKDYAAKADIEPSLKKQKKAEDAPSNDKDENNDPEKASSLSPNLNE